MARVALAIAYDGTRFESYARQPGRRTVEGELIRLLTTQGAFEDARTARWRSGSRTDAGVSAAWNVVAFDSDAPARALVAATTRAPEGLHLLAGAHVKDDFDPRHARRRVYEYSLGRPWDWKRVGPTARAFEGSHDFTNFRKADGEKLPTGHIERIRYRARPPRVEFMAPSFLWHQVRRIVAALEGIQERRLKSSDVLSALRHSHAPRDLGLAPAEPLLLARVEYDDVAWGAPPTVARLRLRRDLELERQRLRWLEAVPGVRSERGP